MWFEHATWLCKLKYSAFTNHFSGICIVKNDFPLLADRPYSVAEPSPSYQSLDEKTLLKHYREIPAKADKQLVVRVARLATRK